MSHYLMYALVPPDIMDDEADRYIEELMSKYDENLETEPVKEYIKGVSLARMKEHYGTNDLYELVKHKDWVGSELFLDDGGLYYNSTRNPLSKWDWYQIGGRWTSVLDPTYNPETDPDNIEECNICNGTGDRPGWVWYDRTNPDSPVRKFKDDWAEQCNGCNGCKGEGRHPVWPSSFKPVPHDRGAITTDRLIALINLDSKQYSPFGIVTKDGWAEKGNMGWWGIVMNEKDQDDFNKVVLEILGKYSGYRVYVLDCHI